MGCGALSGGFQLVCNTPLQGGLGSPDLGLIDEDAFSGVTESASTPNLITAISLNSGYSAYRFQGFKTSLKPSVDVVIGASGQTLYKHRVSFMVFGNSQLIKNEIQKMGNGRFRAIIENAGKNSDSFEFYGNGVGMEVKAQKVRDLQENNASYMILLETPDNELEVKLPQTFYSSSYSSTKTAVLALYYLPTITTISDLAISTGGGDAETITGTNFYGSGSQADVSSVQWVNRATGALTTQTSVTVASATSITFSSVALTAGTYNLRITTSKGYVDSTAIVTVS